MLGRRRQEGRTVFNNKQYLKNSPGPGYTGRVHAVAVMKEMRFMVSAFKGVVRKCYSWHVMLVELGYAI